MKPVSKQALEKRIIAALKSPVIDLEKIKEDLEKLKSADNDPEKSRRARQRRQCLLIRVVAMHPAPMSKAESLARVLDPPLIRAAQAAVDEGRRIGSGVRLG